MISISTKADTIGIVASALCLIHCIATPFIFIAKACAVSCCAASPLWWQLIDYIFVIISFGAIYHAARNSRQWIRIAMWSTWSLLLLSILNNSLSILPIHTDAASNLFALIIIGMHIYNYRECRCSDNNCYIPQ